MRAAVALVLLSALCALQAGTSPVGEVGRSRLLRPSGVIWPSRAAAPRLSNGKEDEDEVDDEEEDIIHFPGEDKRDEREEKAETKKGKDEGVVMRRQEGDKKEESVEEDEKATTEPQEDVSNFFHNREYQGTNDIQRNGAVTSKPMKCAEWRLRGRKFVCVRRQRQDESDSTANFPPSVQLN